MDYNEMKNIVETIDYLKSLSFNNLDGAKKWARLNCSYVCNNGEKDFFDFDYKMLTGTFYKRDNGEIELGETVTVYDEHGDPKMTVEIY